MVRRPLFHKYEYFSKKPFAMYAVMAIDQLRLSAISKYDRTNVHPELIRHA